MKKDISLIVSRIKFISKNKNISLRQIAISLKMTYAGFYRSLQNGSIKVKTLLEVSDILEIEPHLLFYDNEQLDIKNSVRNDIFILQNEIIEDYKKTIEFYKSEIERINNHELRIKLIENSFDKKDDKKLSKTSKTRINKSK